MTTAIGIVVSYLAGAFPTSFVVAKAFRGIDLREVGSKNLGATNVYRTLGWRYAVPVGLVDVLKGTLAVQGFGRWAGGGHWIPLACGLAAVLGHVFSVFVRFKGGKGVATATGVVLGLVPWATLAAGALWAVLVKLTGYVSVGSIAAAAALPALAYWLHPDQRDFVWFFAALGLFVIVMHRRNIARLLAGTENRFGRKGPAA